MHLFHQIEKEEGVADDVAAPHAAWLLDEAVEPLKGVALPPEGGTLMGAGKEIEDGADGTYMAVDVEALPVAVGPFFLFRSGHAYPEQVGVGGVDGTDDGGIVFGRENGFVRWGICHYRKVRILDDCMLSNSL